mmetsp:Transcript_29529/g.75147  ORF Transcript_29529/g.75147 Transcript_29529/m.75147 type:complete len:277 (-) Transcript_29529:98-928(-)|eukprot:CAMPEP_0195072108 /NCGR_PEP_ID=MMETSP0448-20130528/15770_1 /TAXON_ID=66468 /ORGANISM="Heterocapsa triquestra, Strain CCMP 448" /LENGTH=276 /DNA_ID=CAMNT_0040104053 /DNA_START=44 /DNA_END=874 /DNA_ORIENTATION=+
MFDDDLLDEVGKSDPILVCWYSGGYKPADGEALLANFLSAAADKGLETLVLHYPDVYEIEGEGSDPWARYVDRLVEEIDSEPSRAGRPLFLFGHSRGQAPAMTVAARLGERVLKVYIVASGSPIPGQPSGFQTLAEGFKKTGDVGLLTWFVSLNPGNLMLMGMLDALHKGTMKPEDSPFLNDLLTLMRKQYKDAIWPDMTRDMQVIPSPIMAVGPRYDADSTRAHMEPWSYWTSGQFDVRMICAGHMDCLNPKEGESSCELYDLVLPDMLQVLGRI